ncbi:MAG: YihY/virulence factor BrkB family protein [Armatimonadota bacterium]
MQLDKLPVKPHRLGRDVNRVWTILCLAVKKFALIDGTQWAAAFAHYAFFSLFPLIILFVTIASIFINRDRAGTEIISYVESYVPIGGDNQRYIFDTIAGVVRTRGKAGILAFVILAWGSMGFFTTLIRATNRAWGADAYSWWRLPLKSLVFLAIMVSAVLFGIAIPVLTKMAKDGLFPANGFGSLVYSAVSTLIPILMVFTGLSLFYKLAPRRPTRFGEVWVAALFATLFLQASESLFVIYLRDYATFNAVYGAFGGIIALLMWIFLSGCILIMGACLCAAQAEWHSAPAVPVAPRVKKGV